MALDGRRTESTLPKKLNQLFFEPGYIAFLNASLTIVMFFKKMLKTIIYFLQMLDQFLILIV